MRKAGVLHAISSLPSRHGIGDFGRAAYQLIDMLADARVRIWQILPINPLGFGNSPYQPYSSKAIDEIYISLELLQKDHLLPRQIKTFNRKATKVDYDAVRAFKTPLLYKAYQKFIREKRKGLKSFVRKQKWVYHYAVFRALKAANGMRLWTEWPEEHKNWIKDKKLDLTPYEDQINFHIFLQYQALKQWKRLRAYAHKRNIEIMGDIPLYVGIDSDDVWCNQDEFLLDQDGNPTFVAGVPPDYFSVDGQRWGNPLFNWEVMKENGYQFWISRLSYNAELFDIIRIDHFRGLDTYWKIPASSPTARIGEWILGPAYDFFDAIFKALPEIHIVVEDLGDLRPEVLQLRDHYYLRGMNIMQFSFNPNKIKPDQDHPNMIVYTGTHDNETIVGWIENMTPEAFDETASYLVLTLNYDEDEPLNDKFLRYTMENIAEWAIIPTQDILGLDGSQRMNTPGTVGSPNWEWKLASFAALRERMRFFATLIVNSHRK